MDLFLIGKSQKDFTARKIYERKVEVGLISEEIRLLQTVSANVIEGKTETGFDWSSFLDELKFYLYLASWLNLGIRKIIIWISDKNQSLSIRLVKYISISQKVDFLLFNFFCVDVAFIGTRTLLHAHVTARSNRFLVVWTGFVYTLLIIDVIEIAKLQFNTKYETFKILRGEKIPTDDEDLKIKNGKTHL
jgi:hypothetical protein